MVTATALTLGLASPAMADREPTEHDRATYGRPTYGQATLTGFASLPAATFVPGRTFPAARSASKLAAISLAPEPRG